MDAARARYATAYPELLEFGNLRVNPTNAQPAIDLALVLQRLGDRDHGRQLLDASEAVFRSFPRLGIAAIGVADVQIYALRGESSRALSALRSAVQLGWRGPVWRYYRDADPNLASIRGDPQFRAAFDVIEKDLAQQRAMLWRLAESDDSIRAGTMH